VNNPNVPAYLFDEFYDEEMLNDYRFYESKKIPWDFYVRHAARVKSIYLSGCPNMPIEVAKRILNKLILPILASNTFDDEMYKSSLTYEADLTDDIRSALMYGESLPSEMLGVISQQTNVLKYRSGRN